MKAKKLLVLMLSLLVLVGVIVGMTSCNFSFGDGSDTDKGCQHVWSEATCTEPQKCYFCNAETGSALGHTGGTCGSTSVCERCNQVYSSGAAHKWAEATCTEPKHCTLCDTVEGKALGHVGGNATCESPAICDRCNNSYGDKADHNWIGATCTEPKHCGVCGTAEGDALGHKGGNATCTDKAICQNCNQAYGEPLGHAWVEATCTEAKHCKNCTAVEGEPLGHKGGTPTCEGPAECEVCDTPYGEPGTHKGGTATCTKGAVCSTCQQEYTAPLGHDWTEASCTDAKHCKNCGATEGAPLGHEGGVTNCTTLPVCNICGESYGTTSEHDYTFKNTDASYIKDRGDCTTAPTYYISCSVCGDRDESNTFEGEAPLGHSFGEYETENGVHTRTCTVCHTPESGNCLYDAESGLGSAATCEKPAVCSTCAHEYGEALGHDWDEGKVTTVPTCTVPGVKTYNCKTCGETKTESVDPTGHSFGEFTVTTKPTCTVAGVETAYCSCGEPKTQPISATGHTPGIAATCEAAQVCTVCTAELAPATGHNYVLVSSTPATCTSAQKNYYECACTKKYNEEVRTPTEHNIKGVTPTQVAVEGKTCEFVQHYKCNGCGTDVEGKTVTNHAKWTAAITTPATCATEGVKTLTCESCGETKTEVIAVDTSLGHAWDGGVTADGVTTYSCTRGVCDATKTVKVITSGDKVSGSDLDNEIQVGDDTNLGLDDGLKDIIGDQEISVSSDKITGDDKYNLGLTDDQLAQIGNNPIYNFTIEGENGLISDFTGANGEKNYITITIPYELADGEDVDSIAVWFIDDNGEVEAIKATYNDGYVTFQTDHFSRYATTRLTPKERCDLYGHTSSFTHVDPTCTEDGYTLEFCIRCGYSNKVTAEGDEAFGHSYVEATVPATCTEAGSTTYTCSTCTHSYTVVIPALNHNYVVDSTTDATCMAPGEIVYVCDREGCDASYTETLAQLEHNIAQTVTAPTCVDGGYTTYHCVNDGCEYSYVDSYTAPTGHDYNIDFKWDGDDYKHGRGHKHDHVTVKLVCKNCGDVIDIKDDDIHLDHEDTKPGCDHKGHRKTTFRFTHNGHVYEHFDIDDKYFDGYRHEHGNGFNKFDQYHHWNECKCGDKEHIVEHSFGRGIVTKVATCTTEGEITYTCECGYTKTEIIPKTKHSFSKGWTSDESAHWKVCSVCDTVESMEDHSFGKGKVTKAPSCAAEGEMTYRCDCGYVKTEVIPKTDDHKYSKKDIRFDEYMHWYECRNCHGKAAEAPHSDNEAVVIKPVTCTKDGETRVSCSCGFNSVQIIPALGHSFTNYVSNGDAICGADGTKTAHCDRGCGETDTLVDEGSALEHSFTNYVSNGDAACGVDGTKTAHCDNGCGESKTVTDKGSALKHSFTNYVSNGDAVCEADGTKTAVCDHGCGETSTVTDRGSALEHSFTYYVSNGDAVCEVDGTKTAACDRGCGKTDTVLDAGSALQHYAYRAELIKASTCTEDGERLITCICGLSWTEVIPMAGGSHVYDENDVKYDETNHWYECTACGAPVELEAHRIKETVITNGANCNEPSVKTEICSCGYVISTENVTGYHQLTETVTIDLEALGICGGGTLSYKSCLCGETTELPMDDDLLTECDFDVTGENYGENADGSQWMTREMICSTCGLVVRTDGYAVKINCKFNIQYIFEFSINGEILAENVQVNYAEEDHNIAYDNVYLSDYCGGYAEVRRCQDCGIITKVNEIYPNCSIEEPDVVETVVDGITYTVMSATCSNCGLYFEVTSWNVYDTLCEFTTYEKTVIKNGNKTVIEYTDSYYDEAHEFVTEYELNGTTCDEGYYVTITCKNCDYCVQDERWYHSTKYYSFNSPCGSYFYGEKCNVCDEWTYSDYYFDACDLSCITESTYTEDGIDYLQLQFTCTWCGYLYTVTNWVESDDTCERREYNHLAIELDGEVLVDYIEIYVSENHSYEITYELNGTTCDEGYTVYEICSVCGDTTSYEGSGHRTTYYEYNLSDYGIGCGGYAYLHICNICGISTYDNVHTWCGLNYEGVNEDGYQVYRCYSCDTVRLVKTTYSEKDENCQQIINYSYIYLVGDTEVFSYCTVGYTTQHNYEETVTMFGDSCDDGYTVVRTCLDCDYSYENTGYGHSHRNIVNVDFAEYNCCSNHYFRYYECYCGQYKNSEWDSYNYSYNSYTKTYTCNSNCGVVVKLTYEDDIDGCNYVTTTKTTLWIGDEEIAFFTSSENYVKHDLEFTAIITDGVIVVNSVCSKCDYSVTVGDEDCSFAELEYNESEGIYCYDFEFTPDESGSYQIYSLATWDTYVHLYVVEGDSYRELTLDDDGGSGNNFKLTYYLEAGVTYVYRIRNYNRGNDHTSIPYVLIPASTSVDNNCSHRYVTKYILSEGAVDCTDGVVYIYYCERCGNIEDYNARYHHETLPIERIDLSEYGVCSSSTYIEKRVCACGYEESIGFSSGCSTVGNWEYYTDDDGVYHQVYTESCSECGFRYARDYYYTTVGCVRGYVYKYDVYVGEEHILADFIDWDHYWYEHNNGIPTFVFDTESENCESGVTVYYECIECGVVTEEHYTSHNRILRERAELTDFGACGDNSYVELYVCPCGESTSYNEGIFSCSMYGSWNNFYDDNGVYHEVYTRVCSECGLTIVRDRHDEYVGCKINCTYTYTVSVGDTVIVDSFDYIYSTGENHTYGIPTYTFLTDVENCENGVTVHYTCQNCEHSYDDTRYYHSNILKARYELKDHGACGEGAYVEYYACPCGESSSVNYSFNCSGRFTNTEYYADENGISHVKSISTCSDCDVVYTYCKYIVKEGCQRVTYSSYSFTNGEGEIFSSDYFVTNRNTNHNYQYESIFDNNGNSCESGVTVNVTCADCDYTNSYYYTSHERVISNRYYLSDYGSCGTDSYVVVRSCACGENKYLDRSIYNCSLSSKYDYYTDDNGVYHEIYTRVCTNCALTLVRDSYTIEDGCDRTQYYTYTVSIGDEVIVDSFKYIYSTGKSHTYGTPTYTFNTDTENCESGVTFHYACQLCDYSYDQNRTYHESILKEEHNLSDYGVCGGYVRYYACPCEYTSSISYSIDCSMSGNDEYYTDENGMSRVKYTGTCSNCNMIFSTDRFVVKEGCQRVYYCDYDFVIGNTEIISADHIVINRNTNHSYQYESIFDNNGNSCESGVTVNVTCADCDYTTSYYLTGHDRIISNYYYLSDYGVCGLDSYVRVYSCACAENKYFDYSIYSCPMNNSWNSYTDENGVYHEIYNGTCSRCDLTIARETYTVVNACDRTQYSICTISVGDTVIVENFKRVDSTWKSHTYGIPTYTFNTDVENCESGVTVYYTCKLCAHTYDEYRTYHSNNLCEEYDLSDYGACGGYIRYYACPCGYSSSLDYSTSGCNRQSNTEYYTDANGISHVKYTSTCSNCDLVYSYDRYIVKEGCQRVTYYSYSFTNGDGEFFSLDYYVTERNTNHNYQYESIFDNNGNSCESGVTVNVTCADCDYTNSYYYTSHERVISNYYYLSDYGVCGTGSYVRVYSCACGENKRFDSSIYNCSLSSKYDYYTDDNGVYHEIYTRVCTNCALTLVRDSYTIADGCDRIQYYTYTVSIGDEVIVDSFKYIYSTGKSHTYGTPTYTFNTDTENCESGVTFHYACQLCDYTYDEHRTSHYRILKEEYNLSDYGVCGGTVRYYSCPCGYSSSVDYSSSGCSRNSNTEYYVGEDGLSHEKYTSICSKCAFMYSYDKYVINEGCQRVDYQNYNFTRSDINIFSSDYIVTSRNTYHNYQYESIFDNNGNNCESGVTVNLTCADCDYTNSYYYTSHERVISNRYYLSDYGSCGVDSYVRVYSCACGYSKHFNRNIYGCSMSGKTEYYTDDNGVSHSVYTTVCSKCALTLVRDSYTIEDGCDRTQYYTYTVSIGDEVIVDSFNYIYSTWKSHTYGVPTYTFNTDVENCESGVTFHYACQLCDYSYDDYCTYHNTLLKEEHKFSDYGACGGYVSYYECPCGYSASVSYSNSCNTDSYTEHYVDGDGIKHNKSTTVCRKCGLLRVEDTYVLNDGCQRVTYRSYSVSIGNTVIFSKDDVVTDRTSNHSYQYEVIFDTESRDCHDGVTINVTCADCDYTGSYHTTSHDRYIQNYYYLGEYGACGATSYFRTEACACGYNMYCSRGLYICSMSGEWTYYTDDNGIRHSVYTEACKKCGLIVERDEYTVTNGCSQVRYQDYSVFVGDKVVVDNFHYVYSRNDVHTYGIPTYTFLTDTKDCTSGVTYHFVCSVCDYKHDSYYTNHHPVTKEYFDLTDYGACDNRYIEYLECACGKENGINHNICYNNYTTNSYYDEDGVYHHVDAYFCNNCGLRYQDDYTSIRDSSTCIRTYYHNVYVNIGTQFIADIDYVSKSTEHNYKVTSKLQDGATSCTEGATVTYTCRDCGYSYTNNYSHHEKFEVERYDMQDAAYGSALCEGYFYKSSCACGEYNSMNYNSLCHFGTYSITSWIENAVTGSIYTAENPGSYFGGNNAYRLTCSVTDPEQCGYTVRYTTYWLFEEGECRIYQYQTWQFGYDMETGTCAYEVTFKTGSSHTSHPYVQSQINVQWPNGYTKENGYRYDCPNCGSYYYEKWIHDENGSTTSYERFFENKLNDGERKIYEHRDEFENSQHVLSLDRYVSANDIETWYKHEYSYNNSYTGPFGDSGCEGEEKYSTHETPEGEYEWTHQYAYVYYKGYQFYIYNYYFYPAYWVKNDHTYDLTTCENTTRRTTSYGSDSTDTVIEHRGTYDAFELYPTCTQDGYYDRVCTICEGVINDNIKRDPYDHNWVCIGENLYFCSRCGIENINGASGDVVMEDLTAKYGNGENYVAGYWSRNNVQFVYYVSLWLHEPMADGNDQIVLFDIEVFELDNVRALAFSKSAVIAAAEALGYSDGEYDVSISFVPLGADGSYDYSVIFTDDEIPTINDSVSVDLVIPLYHHEELFITPSVSGTWIMYTTNNSFDVYGELYDESGNKITYNDDDGDGNNFYIAYSLEAGKTYTLRVRPYSYSTNIQYGNVLLHVVSPSAE